MNDIDNSDLFWLGPLCSDEELYKNPAVSPAANRWQQHLIDGLKAHGTHMTILAYTPAQIWPKGILFPACTVCSESVLRYSYINLPLIRNLSILLVFFRQLINKRKIKKGVLVTYNAPVWIRFLVLLLKSISNIKWIVIMADGTAPKKADGYIFLSWGYFQSFQTVKPKLHLDGALYKKNLLELSEIKQNKNLIFLYSGSLSVWGGVELLISAFKRINDPYIELWITGKGDNKNIIMKIADDPRIKFLGFLAVEELEVTFKEADVFVNPRPPTKKGNELNFPSKLFDYLAYNKPIISSWSAGLSPVYRELLYVVEPFEEERIVVKLKEVISASKERNLPSALISSSCLPNWSDQTVRFTSFINQVSDVE
jgi:glycosyltransferase involved in cell wall biosynthesis